MTKKILVLGGSGFLGSHVADALTNYGYKVIVADKKKSQWINKNQIFKTCDIKNNKHLEKLTKGMHAVFNFAAIADLETSLDNPIETVETNILPVVNLLKICKKNKVKRFVQASTVYVGGAYGSFYKSSKLACESYIEEFQKRYNLDYSILRYGTIYGPRSEKTNSVFQIIKNALKNKSIVYGGNPEIVRDYIHVYDAAKASVKSLENDFKKKKIKSLIKDYTINKPIIIAGFGDDGHFASIFPSSKFYSKLVNLRKKKYIFKVEKIGEPCVERITMNLSLVINSKKIILVISNKKKKKLFKHFINKNNKKNTTVKILVKNAKNKLLIYNNKRLYVLREFLRNNLA